MPERKDCKVTTHQLPVFLFIFHIILIGHKLRIYLYSTMFCHLVDNQAHSFIPTRNCTTLVWSQKIFLYQLNVTALHTRQLSVQSVKGNLFCFILRSVYIQRLLESYKSQFSDCSKCSRSIFLLCNSQSGYL